jgi:hypothetical protein
MRVGFVGTSLAGVLFGLLMVVPAFAYASWDAPKNPDPSKILEEAQDAAAAGRYADALAKHVWFHENALKSDPAMSGVRLSFALSYWKSLGEVYPPAMEKLRAIRDEAGKAVREGTNNRHAFNDFAAINRELNEEARTKELFVWLDANQPGLAKNVYGIAQPALVKAKEYRLCGKYVEADRSFREILRSYRDTRDLDTDADYRERLREFAETAFMNETATLVALLTINDQPEDADRIAAQALKEFDNPGFRAQLKRARQGEAPTPWP